MSRLSRMTVAAVAMVMLVVNLARASVLDQVPGETMFVVKVTNLKSTSDKLSKFATDLGVAAFAPPLADPLGFLQEQAGIKNGLRADGDLLFAFIDPATTGGNPDKSFVVLVPVSDFAGFISNFEGAKVDGAVTEFTPPNSMEPVFAAQWGEYAALAPTKEIAGLKPAGLKVAAVSASELKKDLVFLANFNKLRGNLQPALAEGRAEILANIEEELTREAPEMAKFGPTLKVGLNRAFDVADSFLRDATAASIALNFVPEGLNVSVVAEFTEGSYLGNVAAASKSAPGSFTKGLPAGKYLFFGGYAGDPQLTAKLIDDILAPVVAELKKVEGKEAEAVDRIYSDFLAYAKAVRGQTTGVLAPEGEVGQAALLQAVGIYTGDAATIKKSYLSMMQQQSELMTAFGLPDQMRYTITPGAKTVEGVTFDLVAGDFKFDAANPDAAQAEQMMKFLYGPEGMRFHVGVLDANTLLQTFGVSEAVTAELIKSARAGADPLGDLPGVKAAAAQLPASKSGAFFVPVDEVANTALNIARQFGFGVNVQMQPDLPPLAISLGHQGTALRIDAHAPSPLISQLIAAGFQVAMQAQGGGGRGNRGGPGGL